MYQDLINNNRLTEIDYINGAVAQLGKEHHIDAPVNQFVANMVHANNDMQNNVQLEDMKGMSSTRI